METTANHQSAQPHDSRGDAEQLDDLLDQLLRAGQVPDRGLLDRVKAHGPAAVPRLIELALDDELHFADASDPAVWAPIHAVQLLGELRVAEAVRPLLTLFELDDDWLPETLETALGQIGRPALAPLEALVDDRSVSNTARITAVASLGKIAKFHPELRCPIVTAFVRLLSQPHPVTDEDAVINGFIVSTLLDLRASDATPAIERAFERAAVDTYVIDAQEAERSLGVRLSALAKQTQRRGSLGRMIDSWQIQPPRPPAPQSPSRNAAKVGRNDPCPCGSGKKYKLCCGR